MLLLPIHKTFTAGLRRLFLISLVVVSSLSVVLPCMAQDPAEAALAGQLAIGMNLGSVKDWSTSWDFVDVFKHHRPWIPQQMRGGPWNTEEEVELTPEGYPLLNPGQAAATLMCREINGRYPGGVYVCTFEGKGTIDFGMDAIGARRATANRYEVSVRPGNGGILLKIIESDPNDPIRNIRVWMPGFENAQSPFHPLFIERLKPFKVIRFMDWGATNNSTLVHWADRTTPQSIRQSGPNGVALEYMIELCNELQADPWFCMPHLADDDFVRQFATMVRDRLHPDAQIYVEWSNEAWNTLFSQGRWVQEQAKLRGIPAPYVTADEALRDWKIWHEVFGDQKHRIIRVAAGQHYNPWVAEKVTERLNGEFDAISCAAYFGPRREDAKAFTESTTAEEVLRSAIRNIEENSLPRIARHAELAAEWSGKLNRHIPLIAYEGGQHIIPIGGFGGGRNNYVPWKQAAWDCQTHPLMTEAYRKMLEGFHNAGGSLFVAFAYVGRQGRYGSWGHLQYQDEPLENAPKYRALLEYGTSRP